MGPIESIVAPVSICCRKTVGPLLIMIFRQELAENMSAMLGRNGVPK